MKPIEKAMGLIVSSLQIIRPHSKTGTFKGEPSFSERVFAKKAALLSVDTAIEAISKVRDFVGLDISHLEYWQKVRAYINNYTNYNATDMAIDHDKINAAFIATQVIDEVNEIDPKVVDELEPTSIALVNEEGKVILVDYRPECVFNYCPNPEGCQDKCQNLMNNNGPSLHVPNRYA